MKAEERLPAAPRLKGRFPFRLGTTSHILPDALIPNVAFLSAKIDDVELVLFESGDMSNLPDYRVVESLRKLKQANAITYTVHLPLDVQLGARTEGVRSRSLERCREIIHLCEPLEPFAYIVHFHGDRRGPEPSAFMKEWRRALDRSSRALANMGIPSRRICVETLDYPFGFVEDIVSFHGLSVCLDIGHLAFYGYPIAEYLDRYLERSPVIHLHGHRDGADHLHVGQLMSELLADLIGTLAAAAVRSRVLTLEVFGLDDFLRSMTVMKELAG